MHPENDNRLGNLDKKSPGCVKASVSDADNFSMFFPTGASLEDKALLLASILFLDYMYFEEKGNEGAERL